jgi:hypothetical protein
MTFNELGDLAAGSISHFVGLVKLGNIQTSTHIIV